MHQALLDALNHNLSSSSFFTKGKVQAVHMELDIKGLGAVKVPIAPGRAKQLIKQCSLAPYGQGKNTLINTSVRNVWELDPRKFKIISTEWRRQLNEIVNTVSTGLNVAGRRVSARLYKLLAYEEGCFFLPHQDTERNDGMFASLIISLPSAHKGGNLIVEHKGLVKKFSFGNKDSASTLQYAGFYADCCHEVKPITEGYRICLIYNLSLASKSTANLPPGTDRTIEKISNILRQWHDGINQQPPTEQAKKAFLLEHEYTSASLSLQHLKGSDFIHGQIIQQAAKRLGFDIHLALLSYYISGEPEMDYDDYSYGRGYDHNDDIDEATCAMSYVIEEYIDVKSGYSLDGKRQNLGALTFTPANIIANTPFTERSADETEYEGYMGNYGPTLERWYHRAAIIFWPQDYRFNIMARAGPEASVPDLLNMLDTLKCGVATQGDTAMVNCHAYATQIIAHGANWDAPCIKSMCSILTTLNSQSLALDFTVLMLEKNIKPGTGRSLSRLFNYFAWSMAEKPLMDAFSAADHAPELLMALLTELNKSGNDTDRNKHLQADSFKCHLLFSLAKKFMQKLENQGNTRFHYNYGDSNKQTMIKQSLSDCANLFSKTMTNKLIVHYLNTLKQYPMHKVHILLLKQHHKHQKKLSAAMKQYLDKLIQLLQERTRTAIRPPAHWGMDYQWSCSCSDCELLKTFLINKTESKLAVKLAKERRRHMHQIIDGNEIDVTHVTVRKGSPLTLVFQKHRDSYIKRENTRLKELKVLESCCQVSG